MKWPRFRLRTLLILMVPLAIVCFGGRKGIPKAQIHQTTIFAHQDFRFFIVAYVFTDTNTAISPTNRLGGRGKSLTA